MPYFKCHFKHTRRIYKSWDTEIELPLCQYKPKWEWAPSTGGGPAHNKITILKDDLFTNNKKRKKEKWGYLILDLGETWNQNEKPIRKQLKHIPAADICKKLWLHLQLIEEVNFTLKYILCHPYQ